MDKKLLGLSMLFVGAFAVFAVSIFFNGSFNRLTRAEEDTAPSVQKSLLFAWPLDVVADGQTQTEITVFIRNDQGKGLVNQPVSILSSVGTVKEPSVSSDVDGKAIFHISSVQPGVAEIQGFVNNKKLLRTITVQFQ